MRVELKSRNIHVNNFADQQHEAISKEVQCRYSVAHHERRRDRKDSTVKKVDKVPACPMKIRSMRKCLDDRLHRRECVRIMLLLQQ